MGKGTSGFTLIELMTVIVIITVLASIVVVSYTGIRSRGYDTSVMADMRIIAKLMQQGKIEAGNYPYGIAELDTYVSHAVNKSAYATSPTISYNLLFCYNSSTPCDYYLLAQSRSGKRFYIYKSEEIKEYTGGSTWNTTAANMCTAVASGYFANGAGYSSGDTTTGPWRAWAN